MSLPESPQELMTGFAAEGYVSDEGLATSLFLLLQLGKPLLLEGHAGVGKTEAAVALAAYRNAPLIRLQCYEGLDVHSAVYEWNYQKQLLAIRLQASDQADLAKREKQIFGTDYLLQRPLLQSIMAEHAAPVLLIDEIDRADEEFEAYLLELLSTNQISIPELGTIKAKHPPHVILTSNRTRELSDALKRRCLYHWIDYPEEERERQIVAKRLPTVEAALSAQVVACVQTMRRLKLAKAPGVAETLDWLAALLALGAQELDKAMLLKTLGCYLKTTEDMEQVRDKDLAQLMACLPVS